MSRLPSIFISHGGGPCFFMENGFGGVMGANSPSANAYRQLSKLFPKPKNILVISAHWEESTVTVITNNKPKFVKFSIMNFCVEN